ncbi:hypothetical protein [Pontibacter roseus]|uniref:hypothetical protein n=1 Tax=Pontibacter roseus TaxID=336989 RepID=UPI00035F97BB|nr:hypothetical protein [Pontibacter roseus]
MSQTTKRNITADTKAPGKQIQLARYTSQRGDKGYFNKYKNMMPVQPNKQTVSAYLTRETYNKLTIIKPLIYGTYIY